MQTTRVQTTRVQTTRVQTTKTLILTSLFLLFTSTQTLALSDNQPVRGIAETAEQVRPLMNGQQIPATVEVTTIEGKKLPLGQVLNNKKQFYFFIVVVGALFAIRN